MKSTLLAVLTALAAQEVVGHATWQDLWVAGVDQISPLQDTDLSTMNIGANCLGTEVLALVCP